MLLLNAPAQPLMLPRKASTTIRAFSFGGGVQSTSVAVLQAMGRLPVPYDVFVFANVGADSENPETIRYVEEVTKPYCAKHGINFVEVQKTYKGEPDTLMTSLYRSQRSIDIPAIVARTGAYLNRKCTDDFKITVVDKQMKAMGATHAIMGLGISTDEFWRARDQQWYRDNNYWKRREYPLIDLRISRTMCRQIIEEAGLPMPPKSSCFFCPFTSRDRWRELKRNRPDLFQKAIELEQELNRRGAALGKTHIHLHRDRVFLDQAVGDQLQLFTDEQMGSCDSGYCWT